MNDLEAKTPESSNPLHVLHRDLSTQTQVQILLGIAQTMIGFLVNPDRESETIPGSHPAPGEARSSAEVTLINACNRLDTIIADPKRWGLDYQLSLEKLFSETANRAKSVAKKQQQLLDEEIRKAEAQTRAAQEIHSPHFRYKPVLFAMKDGSWTAFLGDEEHPEFGISGAGLSPAEALQDFDRAFATPASFPDALKRMLQQREHELNEASNEQAQSTPKPLDLPEPPHVEGTGEPGPVS